MIRVKSSKAKKIMFEHCQENAPDVAEFLVKARKYFGISAEAGYSGIGEDELRVRLKAEIVKPELEKIKNAVT